MCGAKIIIRWSELNWPTVMISYLTVSSLVKNPILGDSW
jgi:hypothetical protein